MSTIIKSKFFNKLDKDELNQINDVTYSLNNFNIKINNKLRMYNVTDISDVMINFKKEEDKFIEYLIKNSEDKTFLSSSISLDGILKELVQFFGGNKSNLFYNKSATYRNIDILLIWSYITGFKKILPLLLDSNVEEIFTSSVNGNIILDHYIYGRLISNISLSKREILNILYRTAMENNTELNQMNPSIKGDINIPSLFMVRITGDIPPFAIDSPLLNIRKLYQRDFTIQELIKLQTLDVISGSFLKAMITNAVNITIIGNPTSGKTTIQNALLQELPKYWKIFSVENTVESNIISPNYYKFKILEYIKKNRDLNSLVSQLLHRSPDYVNLGEITTSEEAIAWISCISAGIPVIQTIHSISKEGILPRLIHVFKIPKGLIANSFPHIFIELRYFWINTKKIRKIISISEVILSKDLEIIIKSIANYSIQKNCIQWLISPKDAITFQWIKKNRNLNIEKEFEHILTELK